MASEHIEMRNFVRDFFAAHGAEVKKDNSRRLEVRLGGELRKVLGRDKLAMVFQAKHATETTELLTPGSFLMDAIHSFLQAEGWKAFVSLPANHRLTAKQAAQRVSPVGCELGRFQRRSVRRAEVHFQIKVGYISDERSEEVVSVCVGADGQATDGLSPEQIAQLGVAPTRGGFLAKAHVLDRFRTAAEYVEQRARARAQTMQRRIHERLYRNVTRIKAFYERMIADASRRQSESQAQEQIASLEDEMAMKLREQVDNHRLRVVLRLLNFCVVERPMAELFAEVSRGAAKATYALSFDRSDGTVTLPACAECGNDLQRPALCDNGHLVCEDCVATCAHCGAVLCHRCGVADCAVCGKAVCTACGRRCTSCTQLVCAEHVVDCCACGRAVCPNCTETCSVCGRVACREHVRECAVCGQPVCHNCQTTCGCCGKVFCREHAEVCGVCGQVMCSDCARECSICGQPVCAPHFAVCAVCSAGVCASHFIECADCGKTICTSHAELCSGCGENVCKDHLSECQCCGERYCLTCFGGGSYCRGCLALILDLPDAEYAQPEQVQALAGHTPSHAELRNWRVYATPRRYVFLADGPDMRTLIVADENLQPLRRRRLPYMPRRDKSGNGV